MPSKIVLLRHGEKPAPKVKSGALQLSAVGQKRAQFLARTYLGRGATQTLLGGGAPDAFFAITPHTIETASPSAESWGLPVTAFCTVADGAAKDPALDLRTQAAAREVMSPRWDGKTIVMVWEHKRIASSKLAPETTLRRLLNLESLRSTVPTDWLDSDYDSLWTVTYQNGVPVRFETRPQGFVAPKLKAKKKSAKKPGKKARKKPAKKSKAKARRRRP